MLSDVELANSEALLTPGEVATLFRVTPKTVTRWAEAGKLPTVRTLGGHRRFHARDVLRVRAEINSRKAAAAAAAKAAREAKAAKAKAERITRILPSVGLAPDDEVPVSQAG
jgi:excisionase family DNA binding protein